MRANEQSGSGRDAAGDFVKHISNCDWLAGADVDWADNLTLKDGDEGRRNILNMQKIPELVAVRTQRRLILQERVMT